MAEGMTDPSAEAQRIIAAWMADYSVWCEDADSGHSYLRDRIARALAEKDEEIRDAQSRLLDEFVAELKQLDPRPNQWRQTYPFSEAFRTIKELLAEKVAALAVARRERDFARLLVAHLPLCPDHQDKFSSESCQACRAERAESWEQEAQEYLTASSVRFHFGDRHTHKWETCPHPLCAKDRAFLGARKGAK